MDCTNCLRPVLDEEDAYRVTTAQGTATEASPLDEYATAAHVACTRSGTGQKIHITAYGSHFATVSAKIVQPDGSEVPISSIVKSVTIKVTDQEFNTALVEFEGVEFDVVGHTDENAATIR